MIVRPALEPPKDAPAARTIATVAAPPRRVPQRVHTRLQQRRPVAVRRHAVRKAVRVLLTFVGDFAALATIGVVLSAVADTSLAQADWARTLLSVAAGDTGAGLASGAGLAYGAAFFVGLCAAGAYGRRTSPHPAAGLLKAAVLAASLAFWAPLLAWGASGVLTPYAVAVAATWTAVYAGRRLSDWFIGHAWPGVGGAAPTILVGSEADYRRAVDNAVSASGGDYRMVGYLSLPGRRRHGAVGRVDELADVIDHQRIETVIVCAPLPDDLLATVLDVSLTAGCELLYPARSMKLGGVRPKLVWRHDEAFLELGAPVLKAWQLMVKRLVDIVGSVAGLVFLAPVLALVALAVKLDSPGPVLFVQKRAGLGGRCFRMLKFRTMRDGADHEKPGLAHLNLTGDPRLFKIPNDPRVTRLGAWLRRWSLDELPQLWNVLLGDMSLIGPRPFFESDLADYQDHHFRRLSVKPGVTGLWQVKGRSSVVDFEEVVRLDREYIERWSPLLDLAILLRTVPAVLRRTGAY